MQPKDSPAHGEVWGQTYVQVGAVKCPIVGQQGERRFDELQLPQHRGKKAVLTGTSTKDTIGLG